MQPHDPRPDFIASGHLLETTYFMAKHHIRFHAAENPTQPAIIMADTGRKVSYRELSSRANQAARMIRRLGLESGDKVALLLENRVEFIELCWAAINSGLVFVPISTHLKPDEASYITNNSGARVLFFSERTAAVASSTLSKSPELSIAINVDDARAYTEPLAAEADHALDEEHRGIPMI
ncbi:MAG: AMP-binding protein, partial [Pseudomonadales bacterium]